VEAGEDGPAAGWAIHPTPLYPLHPQRGSRMGFHIAPISPSLMSYPTTVSCV
jgi:hypothetical protein